MASPESILLMKHLISVVSGFLVSLARLFRFWSGRALSGMRRNRRPHDTDADTAKLNGQISRGSGQSIKESGELQEIVKEWR